MTDQIRELAGGVGEASADDGPAQLVAHRTHQMEQGVCLQHHIQVYPCALGGEIQVSAKLHGAAWQHQWPGLQTGQGHGLRGGKRLRRAAVHQHRHPVVTLRVKVEGVPAGFTGGLVKPQTYVALVQRQL